MRLLAAPLFAAAVLHRRPGLAVLCFAAAVVTDFADGWVARRFGEVSAFGGRFDHAVDAVFVAVGSGALAWTGALPAALAPAIALAFLQYAFDSRRLAGSGLVPNSLGRVNGIAYWVAVAVPVVRDALALGGPSDGLVRALGWLLVASTALSMLQRLRRLAAAQ